MTNCTRYLLSAALAVALGGYLVAFAPLPLDSTWWAGRSCSRVDPLYKAARIADGLLLTNRLSGMSQEQVVALLGLPPPTGSFSDWDLRYCLGLERGLISIDDEWLVIRLDAHGRVEQARLVTD